ncbi:hypothetical protein ONA70_35685 [Micromonospora yasonensis]|uniref:hypothetical protein n=1 Tax=Micromonospora yasonensis TaxID=1128667 RepID=UPI0022306D90|nr:hypothetical protein [Micromonospora yasonensis]MCW3845418.1 hypothetical protein [Micromonospora yasonensis]
MKPAAVIDRVLGRAHLEIEQGRVGCPVRGVRLDAETCWSCHDWHRTEMDEGDRGVVICRARTLFGGDAAGTPPG